MPSTFIFSGGGTGGHLTPGLAVADELRRRDQTCRIVFVGTDRPLEERMTSRAGYEHRALPVESSRTLRRNPLRFIWGTLRAFIQARKLLRELQPAAVFGLGGFASVPTAWSAARRGVPLFLLEQNAIPGRATRWLCQRSTAVCSSFPRIEKLLPPGVRVVVTGNPVRSEIAALFHATYPPPSGKNTLLILGGSQGATSLNAAVVAALIQRPPELADWRIVHQTGPDVDAVIEECYADAGLTAEVAPFFDDMPARYAAATLVVSRAGATTLAELACVALPAILLPFPHATDNHQLANARVFEQAGAALVIEHQSDPQATAASLLAALRKLAGDESRRHTMGQSLRYLASPDAARAIVDLLESLATSTKTGITADNADPHG